MRTTLVSTFCLSLYLWSPSLAAQSLELRMTGGSYPGSLTMEVGPGQLGRWGTVLLSVSRGPTALKLLDPKDNRSLQIGSESLSLSWGGPFIQQGGTVKIAPIPVPNDPGFRDATIYFQAISWPGPPKVPTFVAKVSNPVSVRFGAKNEFRDRGKQLTQKRVYHRTTPLGGERFLVTGGSSAPMVNALTPIDSTEIYDAYTDTWTAGPQMGVKRGIHTATRLADGRVLIAGGMTLKLASVNSCEVYDPAANKFTATGSMTRRRVIHDAFLLPDGRVLALGGFEKFDTSAALATINSIMSSTEIYDPKTGTWTAGPSMTVPRALPAIVPLPNKRFLIAGGAGWTTLFGLKIPAIWKSTDVYDAATNKFSKGPQMITPRGAFNPVEISNGRWLFAGGANQISLSKPGAPTPRCEIFDPKTMSFKATAPLSWARALASVVPIGGGKYIAIGGGFGAITSPSALGNSEIWDEKTQAWKMGPPLTISRVWYSPLVLKTGQTCLVGGGTRNNSTPVTSTDWYFK